MTHDHTELFSDHPHRIRGFTALPTEDPRISDATSYGAAVTARRHLKTALIAMDATSAATNQDRSQVWRVVQSLAARIGLYEQENNLPPADVTP